MKIIPVTKENMTSFRDILFDSGLKPSGKRLNLGFMEGDTPIGTAVVDDSKTVLNLESIYILPEYRRQGYGSRFMDYLLKAAAKKKSLFLISQFPHRYSELEAFFLSCGFLLTQEADIYGFFQSRVIKNATARKMVSRDYGGVCKPVADLSPNEEAAFLSFIRDVNYPEGGLKTKYFDPALSSCAFDKEGHLRAFMICSVYRNDIVVEMLAGRGKENFGTIMTFKHLLNELDKKAAAGKMSDTSMVVFQGENPSVIRTTEELMEGHLEMIDFSVNAVREVSF